MPDDTPEATTARDERIAELEAANRFVMHILKALRKPALAWDHMAGAQVTFALSRLQQVMPEDEEVNPALVAARPGHPAM